MLRRFTFALVVIILSVSATAAIPPALPRLELLAPHSGAVLHAPEVLFVYTVPAGTEVLMQVDGEIEPLPTVKVPGNERDLFHLRLPLGEGRHQVRLLHAENESELATLAVTYVPPYSLRRPSDAGDTRYSFHTREREDTCSGCHALPKVFETVEDRPLAPAGKVCGACHPQVEEPKYLHGPVAVYACFTCHEPEYTPARFAGKTSQAASCGNCHSNFLARVLGGKKFVHGPVAAGGCLVCHSPHGGATQNLVRVAPPDLCLLCHAETLPLPIERSLHGSVPCTRCHDPHGGSTPMLSSQEGNGFCAGCHPDAAQMQAGHPIPGHPVEADVDPARPGRPLGCLSCHRPHGIQDVSKQGIQQNEDAQIRFCRRCHY
jgi:predicted CXXCH cytochrome family protein